MIQVSEHVFVALRAACRARFENDLRASLKVAFGKPSGRVAEAEIDQTIREVKFCERNRLFVQRDNLVRLAFLLHEYGPRLSKHPQPYWLSGVLQRRHLREEYRLDLADTFRWQP